jgi:LytS/YehU family sensor histidine kinase
MNVTIEVAPEAADMPLPPFLLLPLVENAVKYGSRTSEEKLEIRLGAHRENGSLVLEVANSGRWVDAQEIAPGYGGIGLKNLRERLDRHYPRAHQFSTATENGRVITRVVLAAAPINPGTPDSSQNSGDSSQEDVRSKNRNANLR